VDCFSSEDAAFLGVRVRFDPRTAWRRQFVKDPISLRETVYGDWPWGTDGDCLPDPDLWAFRLVDMNPPELRLSEADKLAIQAIARVIRDRRELDLLLATLREPHA
jgi:hypothetical protein